MSTESNASAEESASEEEAASEVEPLGEAGLEALKAERSARREADKALQKMQSELAGLREAEAARVAELEDASKSEMEKMLDKLSKEQAARQAAEMELARTKVAMQHGLTLDQARRLIGSNEEELSADAVVFLQAIRPESEDADSDVKPEEAKLPSRPQPALKTGAPVIPLNGDKLLQDLRSKLGV